MIGRTEDETLEPWAALYEKSGETFSRYYWAYALGDAFEQALDATEEGEELLRVAYWCSKDTP